LEVSMCYATLPSRLQAVCVPLLLPLPAADKPCFTIRFQDPSWTFVLLYASSVSKLSITVVVQSRFNILGIHATAHCPLQATSYHLQFFTVSFTVTAAPRAISSHCHYHYPPRSTEPIPSVIHHVVLKISSHLAVLRFLQPLCRFRQEPTPMSSP
jgi:hypothetical protein